MKLNEKENKIVTLMTKNTGRDFDLDMLAKVVYQRKKRPEHWRTALAATMRTLAIKTEYQPVRVYRSSALGRGQIATYRAETRNKKKSLHSARAR